MPILAVIAMDQSWKGKEVILTRAGVKLEVSAGEKIAPRTSGVAKDVTFRVLKDKNGRLLIESPRQRGHKCDHRRCAEYKFNFHFAFHLCNCALCGAFGPRSSAD